MTVRQGLDVRDLLGVPWRHAGRDVYGMDCLGLMLEVYRRIGHPMYPLMEITYQEDQATIRPENIAEWAPLYWVAIEKPGTVGDLAFMASDASRLRNHLAVLVGANEWVTTSKTAGVHIVKRSGVEKLKPCYYRLREGHS